MPNHCHNRVTFYSANTERGQDEADIRGRELLHADHTRTRLANTPLMSSDMLKYDWDKPEARLVSYTIRCPQVPSR